TSPAEVVVGDEFGVIRSTDGGLTWAEMPGTQEGVAVRGMSINPNAGTDIVVVTKDLALVRLDTPAVSTTGFFEVFRFPLVAGFQKWDRIVIQQTTPPGTGIIYQVLDARGFLVPDGAASPYLPGNSSGLTPQPDAAFPGALVIDLSTLNDIPNGPGPEDDGSSLQAIGLRARMTSNAPGAKPAIQDLRIRFMAQ
ncbi:MAG: hypothetical protein HY719_17435, partial [Planctomycetes bacterium]|nr:hypothetical protein [Planctomycetota bacterium]